MKILVVNAILYTSESVCVHKVKSIKDCMIYDLCLAFFEKGHEVTLIAAEDYKPLSNEEYPFEIIWMKSYMKKIFIPNKIPFNKGINRYLKVNDFDLTICSEVFSMDTLLSVLRTKKDIIVWQEMSFHQNMAKQMASKIWHNVIVKNLYNHVRIVPRTDKAKEFISQYSLNVSDVIIPHGINMKKFEANVHKKKIFVVSSQLIERKRIDCIINAFEDFYNIFSKDYTLVIIGDGNKRNELENRALLTKCSANIIFKGKLRHTDLIEYLSEAMAMLVYTQKDNSMISIAESIALCTPVITTTTPDNADMIHEKQLGIVSDEWGWAELKNIVEKNDFYVKNCEQNRYILNNHFIVDSFLNERSGIN